MPLYRLLGGRPQRLPPAYAAASRRLPAARDAESRRLPARFATAPSKLRLLATCATTWRAVQAGARRARPDVADILTDATAWTPGMTRGVSSPASPKARRLAGGTLQRAWTSAATASPACAVVPIAAGENHHTRWTLRARRRTRR